MATVRIYKVAELLGLASQDAMNLLKRETGIEVKSASSSIEEIVARQFVERQARKRDIKLPPASTMFADATTVRKPAGKPGAKAPEPPKPAAPALRPRLIKVIKPAAPAEEVADHEATADVTVEAAEHVEDAAPIAESAPQPVVADEPAQSAEPAAAAPVAEPEPIAAAPVATPATPGPAAPAAKVQAPVAAAPIAPVTPRVLGRIVPPSRRLRIEDPVTGEAPAARPVVARPVARHAPAPQPPKPSQAPSGNLARPAGTPFRGPVGPRPPLGGPRPLPSQPVRPQTPGSAPRPGGARPPMQPFRPAGPRSRSPQRRDDRPMAPTLEAPPPITKLITLAEGMTVKDLAEKLEIKPKEVMKKLMDRRMMMTINSTLDAATATTISREFGAEVIIRSFEEELTDIETEASNPEDRVQRAPVVTVMGHVDHGKTTLLDAIRETRVAEKEAGGITQHIGAYKIEINNRAMVFLDTPGHEAFTMMRARGAKVTDIVVLVVAADDGVMPQTREAIDHAKAANVPIVVAINKIDKPGSNAERVKRELSDLGLMPESWGGTTVTVEVSARQKTNIDQLLEMILLVADIGDLKANPKRMASGTVLEAKLDRGRGPVATVLVQDGTLHEGDLLVAGTVDAKVRALFDDRGRKVKHVGPSTPVEVLGLSSAPSPGDTFQVIDDPIKLRQIVTFRQTQAKDKAHGAKGSRLTLESLQQQMAAGGVKELPLIIKADVQGSAEVLADTLTKLSDDRVKIRIVHSGVGAINESDVLLATASNAIIIGFNVRPDRNAADVAERESVDIRLHSIIYNVTDEIKKGMTGLLEPTVKETRMGAAEVRQTFKAPKIGVVAGCYVTEGTIKRGGDTTARLLRDGVVVWTGKLAGLRRFKDDVSEVKSGFECGVTLDRFNDVKVGDMLEVFTVEKIAQAL